MSTQLKSPRPPPGGHPEVCRARGVGSICVVAPRWHWLLVALAAVTVACLVPGSMVSATPSAPRSASIETTTPTPSGSECAAVACNPGSPSASSLAPCLVLAATLAAGALFVRFTRVIRRERKASGTLPEGSPLRLLRPPQLALSL